MKTIILILFSLFFSMQTFSSESFFEKWKSKRSSRKTEKNISKLEKNYLSKQPSEILKQYCICHIPPKNISAEQKQLAADCMAEVYTKANEAKAKGQYIKEKDMYKKEGNSNSLICTEELASVFRKAFKISESENSSSKTSSTSSGDDPSETVVKEFAYKYPNNIRPEVLDDSDNSIGIAGNKMSDLKKSEFKNMLKGKVSDDTIKACTKAFKKGKKEKPDATYAEAMDIFKKNNCDIDAVLLAVDLGGNGCFQMIDLHDDEIYKKFLKSKCEDGATLADANVVVACYDQAKTLGDKNKVKKSLEDCYKEKGKNIAQDKKIISEPMSKPPVNGEQTDGAIIVQPSSELVDDATGGAESISELKKILRGKMSDDDMRKCVKAYRKIRRDKKNAKTLDEVKADFKALSCDIETVVKLANESQEQGKVIAENMSSPPTAGEQSEVTIIEQSASDQVDDASGGSENIADLKKMLKGKVTDVEIRKCVKAYRKVRKDKENAKTLDEVKGDFKALGCDIENVVKIANEGGNECFKFAQDYKTDDFFYGKISKACEKGAPKEHADALASCWTNANKNKDEFLRCGQNIGCSENASKCNDVKKDLVGLYDLKGFGQNLKEEFRVAGCEEEYRHYDVYKNEDRSNQMLHGPSKHIHEKEGKQIDCKENRNRCITARVGQEAAKAILGELAKDGELTKDLAKALGIKNSQLVAATAGLTADALACIPPKAVRNSWEASGTSTMTKVEEYCNYFDANSWASNSYANPDAQRRCLDAIQSCKKYENDPNNKLEFNSCCKKTLAQQIKKEKVNQSGNVIGYNQSEEDADKEVDMVLGLSTSSDGKRQMNSCLIGAGFQGISAFISAVCNDEKKYPTAEKKEECLKKARLLNDIAGIGSTVASCAANGPIKAKKGDKLTEEQEMARRNVNDCLINGLGKQAIDILGRELNLNTKQKNLLDTGFNLTMGIKDCVRSKPAGTNLGEDPASRACLGKVGINGALDLINGQDLIKDPKMKNVVTVGLSVAGSMVACNGIKDQKQRNQCNITGALQGMSKLDGPLGELAGVAAQTLALTSSLQSCPPGDQLCLANALAAQIPGDAKDYIGMMVKGRTLFKQLKNPCQVPSIYLSSGGAAINLVGDLVTHIMHKVQTEKLKKSYSDLVKAQKDAEKEDNLFNNIGNLIAGNDKKREEERAKELEEAQQAAPDAQVRAFEFAIENEKNQLARSKMTFQFQNIGMILNSLSVTMAYIEQTLETTNTLTKSAYWKQCVQTQKKEKDKTCDKGENTTDTSFNEDVQLIVEFNQDKTINQILRSVELNHSLKYLDQQNGLNVFMSYIDQERYIQGEFTSLTTSFYNEMKTFDLEQDKKLGESLSFLMGVKEAFIPSAHAMDVSALANIGFTMANGLFPGKSFDPGSPLGYAQNIVMMGVEEGLKKVCPPEDPATANKEICKWQGGITFAARKISKAMMCTFDTEVQQFMKSGVGRALVGGYVAVDYTRWRKTQKDQLVQQEDRLRTMYGQLDTYKQQTGYNKFQLEKLQNLFRDSIKFFMIDEAHAAVNPKGPKICANKQGNADFSCSCQKTGCFRVFAQQSEGFRKNMGVINQKMGSSFSSVTNVMNWVASMTDSILGGAKSITETDVAKIEKLQTTVNQYNDKLSEMTMKVMIQNKEKPIDKTRAFASLDNALFKNMPKELQQSLKGVPIGKLAPKYEKDGKVSSEDEDSNLASAPLNPVKAEEVVPSEPISTTSENTEVVAKVEDNTHMQKSYQYNKGSDIHQDKDESIFKLINSRYNKVIDRKMLIDE